MLSFEWQELETLCDHLSSLYRRYAAAQRSEHARLVEVLKQDVARVQRQREQLIQYISVRLGVFAAERHHSPRAPAHRLPDRH